MLLDNNNTNGDQALPPNLTPGELAKLEIMARTDETLAAWLRAYYTQGDQNQTAAAAPADPWKVFTLADAYQERPPIEGVISNGANPILELPSLNIVYGPPGSLKSFLLQDLVICVAGGKTWLQAAPNYQVAGYPTQQGPVMWVDFDNGHRRTLDRFGALGKAHNLSPNQAMAIYSMPSPWLQATDKSAIGDLALRVRNQGAKLVCIDNLGCVLGEAEENGSEMAKVMSHFRQLAEDTGAAIVLIHHQRKGNGLEGRAGDTLRGHSSIEAALDLALRIEREPHDDIVNIRATKTRGADVPTIRAMFTYDNTPSGAMQAAKFMGLGTDDYSSVQITAQIFEALESGPMNKTQLAKSVSDTTGEGLNRVRNAIDSMAAQGKITITNGKQGAKVCNLL